MKMFKYIGLIIVCIFCCNICCLEVSAEWVNDRWKLSDGSLLEYTGYATLENNIYYFQDDYTRYKGWLETKQGTYYFDSEGRMVYDFQVIDNKVYYFNAEGFMLQNQWGHLIENDNDQAIYFGKDGYATEVISYEEWCLRKKMKKDDTSTKTHFVSKCTYIVDKESKVYHRYNCYVAHRLEDNYAVYLTTAKNMEDAGFIPCEYCCFF